MTRLTASSPVRSLDMSAGSFIKSVHGLKQAPLKWNLTIDCHLHSSGFIPTNTDILCMQMSLSVAGERTIKKNTQCHCLSATLFLDSCCQCYDFLGYTSITGMRALTQQDDHPQRWSGQRKPKKRLLNRGDNSGATEKREQNGCCRSARMALAGWLCTSPHPTDILLAHSHCCTSRCPG